MGSDGWLIGVAVVRYISIHAPRVGSDINGSVRLVGSPNFNPRSPCGERPAVYWCCYPVCARFQSTLPVWGATTTLRTEESPALFQSTLPVWGATGQTSQKRQSCQISIHAPRVGSDDKLGHRFVKDFISIHAPRVGSDAPKPHSTSELRHFNPRSPCGERRTRSR